MHRGEEVVSLRRKGRDGPIALPELLHDCVVLRREEPDRTAVVVFKLRGHRARMSVLHAVEPEHKRHIGLQGFPKFSSSSCGVACGGFPSSIASSCNQAYRSAVPSHPREAVHRLPVGPPPGRAIATAGELDVWRQSSRWLGLIWREATIADIVEQLSGVN